MNGWLPGLAIHKGLTMSNYVCEQCGQGFFRRGKPSRYSPKRFCSSRCWYVHNIGPNNPLYKGGIPFKNVHGYMEVYVRREDGTNGKTLEHILVAERAIGKRLPENAVLHHVNGDRVDNKHSNLVICENQSYHKLLHLREKRLRLFGRTDVKQCRVCRCVKSLKQFYHDRSNALEGKAALCKLCSDLRRSARRAKSLVQA